MSAKGYKGLEEDEEQADAPVPPAPTVPWKTVWPLYFITAADATALGLPAPFLPAMCRSFFGDDDEMIGKGVGLLTGAFLMCSFFSSFAIGHLSDRFGRKPLLILGLISSTVCTILFGFSPNFYVALVLRAVAGLLDSCPAVSRAALADLVKPAQRGVVFTWLGAIFALGRVLSSSIGGLLAGVNVMGGDYVLPCLIGSLFTIMGALVIAFKYTESYTRGKDEEPSLIHGIKTVVKDRLMVRLIALYGLNSYANGGVLLGLSLLATLPRSRGGFGLGPRGAGVAFGWFGAAGFLVQFFVFQRIARFVSPKKVFLIGGGLLAGSTIILPFCASPTSEYTMWGFMIVILTILGAGFMAALPTVNALMANAANPAMRGLTQGTAASVGSLLRGGAPFIGGLMFAASLSKDAPFVWFLFLGAVYFLCLSIAVSLPDKVTVHEGEKAKERDELLQQQQAAGQRGEGTELQTLVVEQQPAQSPELVPDDAEAVGHPMEADDISEAEPQEHSREF